MKRILCVFLRHSWLAVKDETIGRDIQLTYICTRCWSLRDLVLSDSLENGE